MAIALLESERIPITVVIPTLNEAARLQTAIDTVWWADEIIVVDGGSTDETPVLARRLGAKVITLAGPTIGAQRNAGIMAARNQWILALDADETVSPELRDSLSRLCFSASASHRAFRIRSRNWHLGQELRYGPWGRDWKVRVFSRDQRFTAVKVHENLEQLADVGVLEGTLHHRPYTDLSAQVTKIAKYAKWAADDMRSRGKRGSIVAMLGRPLGRFLRDYFLYSGWRDGQAGFIVASMSCFYVFLKYALLLLPPEY